MKKYRNEIIIVFVNLFIVSLFCFTNIFGSTMDFLSQHIVFPDYLRSTFYETGHIIPKLAINLGAGQNIFNIAYYGLLNPIILVSYLFPFVKMIDYIIGANIVLLLASSILFYRFIKSKFDNRLSLFLTLLFSLSGPIIFQFHRHFMFVNYMPFLILALINIDKSKKINFMIDVFLIIMISFYYSIPAIITILVYYIYKNFNSFKFSDFFKILFYIFISVLMASVLLLPIFSAIVSSRASSFLFDFRLLLPDINLDNMLYGAYSTGLTSIAFISVLYLFFSKKKDNLFLGSVISVLFFIPFVIFLLNGGLYTRSKSLIPLLPLLVYIIGIFIKNLFEGINVKKFLIFILMVNLVVLIRYQVFIYYLDLIFMIILIIIYRKTKEDRIIVIPLVLLNVIICLFLNKTDDFISRDYYNEVSKIESTISDYYRTTNLNNSNQTVNRVYGYMPTIYSSTINRYYYNLYHDMFNVNNLFNNNLFLGSTSNVLFNQYLGVRYIISDDSLGYPYHNIDNNLYELEQALPIAYVNSKTVNKEYFDSLEYPYNLDILLNYVIDENSDNYPMSNIRKIDLNHTYEIGNNIGVFKDNDKIKLNVKEDDVIIINLEDDLNDQLLFINIYGLEENSEDIKITINNQTNLLTNSSWLYPNNNNTFYYCLNNINDKLEVKLTKGIYNITNIETYVLDNKTISNIKNNLDEFNVTLMNTELISGNIKVNNDGYFVLSIPYDNGFKILVNDEKRNYQIINNSFIGFYLEKGDYKIDISYTPPLLNEGILLSVVGFCIFITIGVKEKLKK